MDRRFSYVFGCAIAAGLLPATMAVAQSTITEEALDVVPTTDEDTKVGFRSGSFIIAPIPFSNPTIGNGLAAGVAWLYNADEGSGTSTIGFGGFKSDNGSGGLAFGADLKFNDNKYLASILIGEADLSYDFTGGPTDIELEQSGRLAEVELSYGFTPDFSLGIGVQYAETTLATDFGGLLPPEITAALDLEIFRVGVVSNWDRRDSDLYPTSGSLVTFEAYRGEVTGGLGQDYNKAVLQGSTFAPGLTERDVLALEGTACAATDAAPFFDACSIGLTDGLRGFSVTEYIGTTLVSGQVEYRGRFGGSSFGYAAFVGAGALGGTTTSEEGTHGAAGVGLRYRLSESFPVDIATDVTTNTDGDTFYYIYVGQSF